MGIARKGEGWCKGLPGWFGALFSQVCLFDRGAGVESYLGNAHIEPTQLKKGLPLLCFRFTHCNGMTYDAAISGTIVDIDRTRNLKGNIFVFNFVQC